MAAIAKTTQIDKQLKTRCMRETSKNGRGATGGKVNGDHSILAALGISRNDLRILPRRLAKLGMSARNNGAFNFRPSTNPASRFVFHAANARSAH
jgi:hypothetical protein